jgi:hypothetical protein
MLSVNLALLKSWLSSGSSISSPVSLSLNITTLYSPCNTESDVDLFNSSIEEDIGVYPIVESACEKPTALTDQSEESTSGSGKRRRSDLSSSSNVNSYDTDSKSSSTLK